MNNKPRNVVTIIDQLLKYIPDDEYDLINEITDYGSSLWNQAPEALYTKDCWIPLMNILSKNIRHIDQDWKISLVKIVNNE